MYIITAEVNGITYYLQEHCGQTRLNGLIDNAAKFHSQAEAYDAKKKHENCFIPALEIKELSKVKL